MTWLCSAWRRMLARLLMNLPHGRHTNPPAVDITLLCMKEATSPAAKGLVSPAAAAAKSLV